MQEEKTQIVPEKVSVDTESVEKGTSIIKEGEYQSISAKVGLFKIRSKMTTAGETFELYFMNQHVGAFQASGLQELASVVNNVFQDLIKRDGKEYEEN